jgi:hypothetical protein
MLPLPAVRAAVCMPYEVVAPYSNQYVEAWA